jgi:serine/threonine-protein kinase
VIREGDRVADYEIVARMKAGGMATLFLGRRTGASGFSKPVAIKVVHAHLADDPAFVEMFVDEALLCARIQHPNVVHVEELRESNGAHLLVMEYVAGCSLGQLLRALAKRQRRMTPELAVHVAINVLDGLHAAHELKNEQGAPMEVVHRDVSPDNVLLAWQGHVKLIDFGVAKAMSRRTQTSGSMLKGKIRYMSPEQAFGRAVDRRTDVYALAIVLWECLTMRRLFSGSGADLELLEQVRNPTIVPPSQLVSDLPPALDAILLKALAREANDRYASAREMRRALAEAMPRAAALDGADLAELLRAVMADEIEAQRAKLASDAEALDVPVVVDGAEADEPLRTMTISMAGLSSPSGLISAEHSATSGTAPLPPASSVSSTSVVSPMAAPPAASRSSGLLYALGGGLLVALAGGVTIALTSGSAPEPTATPLAPAVVEIVGAPPSTTDEAANEAAANAANQAAANAANQAAANADQAAAANQAAANAANVAVEAAATAANEAAANGAANEAAAPEDETTTERPRTTETVSSMTPRRTTRPAGDERPSMRPAMRELADDFGF